jgi:hypothetical protein
MKVKTYQNLRNLNKYLEVVRYDCGHYYACQYMQWGDIRNYTGVVRNRKCRWRWKKGNLTELLKDYKEVSA